MPDHVHLLLTPQRIQGCPPDPSSDGQPLDFRVAGAPSSETDFRVAGAPTRDPRWISLSEIVKGIKSVAARKINRLRGRQRGSIWQDEYYDRSVRDPEDFQVKLQYLMHNPVKQDLVGQPRQWDALWIEPESTQSSKR